MLANSRTLAIICRLVITVVLTGVFETLQGYQRKFASLPDWESESHSWGGNLVIDINLEEVSNLIVNKFDLLEKKSYTQRGIWPLPHRLLIGYKYCAKPWKKQWRDISEVNFHSDLTIAVSSFLAVDFGGKILTSLVFPSLGYTKYQHEEFSLLE